MKIDHPMFSGHRPKVPIRETCDARSRIVCLVQQKTFEVIYCHGLEDLAKVNRVTSLQDLSQFLRHHPFPCTCVARRENGFRRFRSPAQGLWEEILHVTQGLLLNLLRICDKVPYLLQLPVRASDLHLLPKGIVRHPRCRIRKDHVHGPLQFPRPALLSRLGHLKVLPALLPERLVVLCHSVQLLPNLP